MNDTPTFEAALGDLEKVLRCLEDGATTLDEGLAQYERGVALLKFCYSQLQGAEQKIALLAGLDETGKPVLKPFAHSASEPPAEDSKRPSTRTRPRNDSGLY